MSPIANTDVIAITRPSGNGAGTYKVTAQDLKTFVGAVGAAVTVENTLSSGSTTNALSAAMGAELKRQLDSSGLSGGSYVRKAGDTMTGALSMAAGSWVNTNPGGGFGCLASANGSNWVYGHTGGTDEGVFGIAFNASKNVVMSSNKKMLLNAADFNVTAGGASLMVGNNRGTFTRTFWLVSDPTEGNSANLSFGDSSWGLWATVHSTRDRTDYAGRNQVWIRSSQQDQNGFVQLHGGSSAGTPFVFSAGSETNRIADVDRSGNWHAVSDRKLKTDIKGIALGLDAVLKMRPCSFHLKRLKAQGRPTHGFIAQEMAEVVPEAVKQNEDGLYTLAPSLLIPVLVKAIQELTARVQQLEGAS